MRLLQLIIVERDHYTTNTSRSKKDEPTESKKNLFIGQIGADEEKEVRISYIAVEFDGKLTYIRTPDHLHPKKVSYP